MKMTAGEVGFEQQKLREQKYVVNERDIGGGFVEAKNHVDASKVGFYYDSFSCHSTDENSLRQGSKEETRTPIKQLLAKELSNKMESRRRSSSVIARLMGLDPLPTQQPIHRKQHKKFGGNFGHRKVSLSFPEKQSTYESRSHMASNKEQQEFKDVFEVETSRTEMHVCSSFKSGLPANSKLSEIKMEYIRQKFMDVKRLSTNEKLQQSKEFHDALEVLDSNKDLLLKFLQEPDSLFTKHLHDLQGFPPSPRAGHITVLKSVNAHNNSTKDLCPKPERKKEWRNIAGSVHNYENGLVSLCHQKHGAHVSSKVTKSQTSGRDGITLLPVTKSHPYERDDAHLLPTSIVVLKPNLRKSSNTATPVSSPCSSEGFRSGFRKQREGQASESLEHFAEVRERRDSSIELELMKYRDRGSREIAKEITRQMRHTVNYCSMRFTNSRLKGYAGDESSCAMSEGDSEYESDMMTSTSRHFSDWKSKYSPSSAYSTESSVSREAKKRLSERWKITHRPQEPRTVGRGSTLAEMLAMPDREIRSMGLDPLVGWDNFNDRLIKKDGAARWASPLGISSKDGWKDECVRSLPRSRSLPASTTEFRIPSASTRGEVNNNKHRMVKEAVTQSSNRLKKDESNQRQSLLWQSSTKASHKKCHSVSYPGEKDNDTVHSQEYHLKPVESESNSIHEKKTLSEQKAMLLEIFSDDLEEKVHLASEVDVSEDKDVVIPLDIHEEQQCGTAACATLVKDEEVLLYDLDDSNPQSNSLGGESPFPSNSNVTEAESPASAKNVEQPSPLSVLEPPFTDDFSSGSDSFERVSADLHELRMQLQLLKLESAHACSEEYEMTFSSDENNGEGSLDVQKEGKLLGMLRDEEKRDYSYMVDVLIESGLYNADQDVIITMWHSPELPVGLSVCDKLEKKYGEQMNWMKSERRLLFDRINFCLIDMFQHCMDPHPWVKKEKITVGWSEESLVEKLWNLLVRHGNVRRELFEEVSGKETKWLDSGDELDAVGREVERSLLIELMEEVMCLYTV